MPHIALTISFQLLHFENKIKPKIYCTLYTYSLQAQRTVALPLITALQSLS